MAKFHVGEAEERTRHAAATNSSRRCGSAVGTTLSQNQSYPSSTLTQHSPDPAAGTLRHGEPAAVVVVS